MNTILFACVHDAGRSQIAAAWFNRLASPTVARAISAGTEPSAEVHPVVAAVLGEAGFDVAGLGPQRLTNDLAAAATMLVTMGCGEACPVVPSVERDDWPLLDPKGQPIERVREIAQTIEARVAQLIEQRGWAKAAATGDKA